MPKIAVANANIALLHSVEDGMNKSARSIPNCAEDMVAPVVGDTNLLLQSCCMISPATLIPIPVHKIARSLGSLDTTNIFNCSPLPASSSAGVIFITPTNNDAQDTMSSKTAKTIVDKYAFIRSSPFIIFS